jgi:hypothetical protein
MWPRPRALGSTSATAAGVGAGGVHGPLAVVPPERCAIAAGHDYGAVLTWLNTEASTLTMTAYRHEVELLLWCVLQRRKVLPSLTLEDALA